MRTVDETGANTTWGVARGHVGRMPVTSVPVIL